jgi:hypothetical protein
VSGVTCDPLLTQYLGECVEHERQHPVPGLLGDLRVESDVQVHERLAVAGGLPHLQEERSGAFEGAFACADPVGGTVREGSLDGPSGIEQVVVA